MLRAIILAMVVLGAIGAIVPLSTNSTEANAEQEERRYEKKSRAIKFRYRTLFKEAKYSESERFKTVAKLREPGEDPAPARADVAVNEPNEGAEVAKTVSTRPARKAVSKKSRVVKTSAKKTRRYQKVRRYKAKKTVSTRASAKKRNRKATWKKASSTRRASKSAIRKYSSTWWRSYRAKQAKEEAIERRIAHMRLRRAQLEQQKQVEEETIHMLHTNVDPFMAEATMLVPEEGAFPIAQDGSVSLELIGPAVGETVTEGRRRYLAGVSTTVLRRTVIDQMIRDNGWVENDYQKEIAGEKVYVVVAKAPDKANKVQQRTFYFTESKGKIYRVSSRSPDGSTEQAAQRSEEMIRSLRSEERTQTAAKSKDE